VRARPDLIVTASGADAVALRRATTTIPIVVAGGGDLVSMGLAASVARPGGNVTGLQNLAPELTGKRLDLLRSAVPGMRRVGVLRPKATTEAGTAYYATFVADLGAAATAMGIQATSIVVDSDEDLDRAMGSLRAEGIAGLVVASDAFMFRHRRRIVELAARHRVPAIYEHADYVVAGGFMSYGPDFRDIYRRAAGYVAKILNGARPAELPIEQPTKFSLVIHLGAARGLGVTVPTSLVGLADRVIE
jgi:putative ABC transport system substrate-binding protein